MKKTFSNFFLTLIAVAVIGFLFYVGAMEANGTPVAFSNIVSEWFK